MYFVRNAQENVYAIADRYWVSVRPSLSVLLIKELFSSPLKFIFPTYHMSMMVLRPSLTSFPTLSNDIF